MAVRHSRAPLAVVAGMLAPPFLAAVFIALTIDQRAFLDASGWSPVRRTPVEWPSVLLLGPHGWAEQVAFVVAAALEFIFAIALLSLAPTGTARLGALLVGVAALALAFMALKPDQPDVATRTWHDAVHDGVYPVIPLASLAAAAALALGLRRADRWRIAARASAAVLPAGLVVLGLGAIAAVAQVTRYFLFASLLIWIEVLAVNAWHHRVRSELDEVGGSRRTHTSRQAQTSG
ncbi:MAG TPA: DUF998 domain-containing protein [Gaiellaceae bacterium]